MRRRIKVRGEIGWSIKRVRGYLSRCSLLIGGEAFKGLLNGRGPLILSVSILLILGGFLVHQPNSLDDLDGDSLPLDEVPIRFDGE